MLPDSVALLSRHTVLATQTYNSSRALRVCLSRVHVHVQHNRAWRPSWLLSVARRPDGAPRVRGPFAVGGRAASAGLAHVQAELAHQHGAQGHPEHVQVVAAAAQGVGCCDV